VVYHPGTEVYADPAGVHQRPDVEAVIIQQRYTQGDQQMTSVHVLPTTRRHFRKGMRVAWEFSDKASWD
jgi:hypothetical protein